MGLRIGMWICWYVMLPGLYGDSANCLMPSLLTVSDRSDVTHLITINNQLHMASEKNPERLAPLTLMGRQEKDPHQQQRGTSLPSISLS